MSKIHETNSDWNQQLIDIKLDIQQNALVINNFLVELQHRGLVAVEKSELQKDADRFELLATRRHQEVMDKLNVIGSDIKYMGKDINTMGNKLDLILKHIVNGSNLTNDQNQIRIRLLEELKLSP